ncbi:MAG: porphobilinogen synthase [bacterium]|nr:porphobilinogen synthase [bacterium]
MISVEAPAQRPRRLRTTMAMRGLVRETRLAPQQLVEPLFIVPGHDRREPLEAMPGHARVSPDRALARARELAERGVGGLLFFGVPDAKDDEGRSAAERDGPVPEAIRRIRDAGLPLVLMADVCLCEYTSHGHCGIIDGGRIDNDRTLPLLGEAAVAYAAAGADIVAPSAMMDGQVGALREALDATGHTDAAVLAYASKHASALYGPFREAAGSTPAFGDRRSYQMDPANGREAMREMALDADEGADLLMVKPALTSLDLLAEARQRFDLPLAAYQVSGELAMLEAASARGWIERERAALETLTAIARAGAQIVITYLAGEASGWLQNAAGSGGVPPQKEVPR